ncbi:MAG: 5-formyltetrahydrofolate cyclo-ligase [Akkermansia sp.]|nr:5-formyltetrahydrofolate cyclo-ligase [Akkermansia sp.]
MPDDTKQQLRQQMLARLREAAAADTEGRRAAALRRLLAPLLQCERPLTIGLYYPLPHEVNLLPLLQDYPQHRFAFPRCLKEHRMEFRLVREPGKDTEPAAMGIPAPKRTQVLVLPQELDLLIVPGVAFTAQGERLGYGGGYYDRYIPLCPQARLLACAFHEQLVPHLPTGPHDCRIPCVLHE